MFLEDMEGSFCDDYKKLAGYANALKGSNPGTDVVLKFNQDSEEGTSNTGQVKSKKQKMDEHCDKEKRQTNERHKTLIDEEDVEYPAPTQDCEGLPLDSSPIAATVEDFPLTAPQPTQDCASEDEDFGLDVEDDMPWKPRDFSELKSRI
uniref:Uncharacterized protein n=1 Tax=Solanum tuberosum TaxID=4113 RepID=M1DRI1_SOLTU